MRGEIILKYFFEKIMDWVNELQSGNVCLDDAFSIADSYNNMNLDDRKKAIELTRDIFRNANFEYIMILNILLDKAGCLEVAYELGRIIEHEDIPIDKKIVMYEQLKRYWFTHSNENLDVYTIQKKLFKHIISEIKDKIRYSVNQNNQKNHNNTVLVTISPMIGDSHGPTRVMINFVYYLQKLGYNVVCLSTCIRNLQMYYLNELFCLNVQNARFIETGKFNINALDVEINGYNICYDHPDFIEQINCTLELIESVNPQFILDIGGANFITELISDKYRILVDPTSSDLPITTASGIFVPDSFEKEKINIFNSLKEENQCLYRLDFFYKCREKCELIDRNEVGLSNDDFVVLVVGNRLDVEFDNKMIDVLEQIMAIDNKIKALFIGECEILKNKINKKNESNRYIFIGYTDRFRETIGLGDVFLNPPRVGGGTSAYYAMEKRVPVISLAGCDVISMSSDEFICESVGKMPEIVSKYFYDKDFMEEQKKVCDYVVKSRNNEEKCLNSIRDTLDKFLI